MHRRCHHPPACQPPLGWQRGSSTVGACGVLGPKFSGHPTRPTTQLGARLLQTLKTGPSTTVDGRVSQCGTYEKYTSLAERIREYMCTFDCAWGIGVPAEHGARWVALSLPAREQTRLMREGVHTGMVFKVCTHEKLA